MKNKKIIIITKYFYPITAGIEISVLETYSLLVKKGWDVTVHTTNRMYAKNKLPKHDYYKGMKIIRYDLISFMFLPNIWSEADVLSIHNFNIFPHVLILLKVLIDKILNKKRYLLVLTPHGGFVPDWKDFNFIKRGVKKLIQFTIGKYLINYSTDLVRAVSSWERDEMFKKGILKKKLIIVSNGLEFDALINSDIFSSKRIRKTVKNLGKYFIQIGRINKIKNYETPIRAMVELPKDINFVIIGPVQDMEYKSYLIRLVKELNLDKRVFFLPPIKGIDKYYIMKNALFMVQMSRLESFCNVVLEGMSQGLVCLVSNKGALPFLVKNRVNGYVLNMEDSKSLSDKMKYVLRHQNSNIIKNMSKNNINFAINNTWDKISNQLNSLYSQYELK